MTTPPPDIEIDGGPAGLIRAWLCRQECCDGKGLHRVDGPAYEFIRGAVRDERWYEHGIDVTEAALKKRDLLAWIESGEAMKTKQPISAPPPFRLPKTDPKRRT